MPLFEIDDQHELVPFRQLRGGADLYEREIEDLLWSNLDAFTGDTLFPVRKQAPISAGGRPDIVALDGKGSVVVIEVKRDVDRSQLAQCLEYAGWARRTSLDELARLYSEGPDQFFRDWQAFTDSAAPLVLSRTPRLLLVARDFHGQTESAFQFLLENGVPVTLVRVSIYEDLNGRRFLDVEGEHEPALVVADDEAPPLDHTKFGDRRMEVSDLLESNLLKVDERLIWKRPRLGKRYSAHVRENGAIELEDGRAFSTPSRAAREAAGIRAYDGWYAWTVERLDGQSLNDLRVALSQRLAETEGEAPSA